MRKRGSDAAPMTLFSFQDIVTSVMGIMVLVMLVIALELAARQLKSPAVLQSVVREDTRQAIELAQAKLERIKAALAAGQWNDLASLSQREIRREQAELERLLPML